MRFILVAASVLGLAAASPCKPKPKTTSLTANPVSSASTSASSAVTTVISVPTTSPVKTTTSSASSVAVTTKSSATTAAVTTTAQSSSTKTSATTTSAALTTTSSKTTTSAATTSSVAPTTTSSKTTSTAPTTTAVPTTTSKAPTTTFFTTTTTSSSTSTTINPATARVTNPIAIANWYNPDQSFGTAGRDPPNGGYVCYAGPASNFPAMTSWASWNVMWATLKRDALDKVKTNTAAEVQAIHDSILDISQKALVDERVILAVIVLESTGNVRVSCTANGVSNCGLMQAYNSSSYDPSDSANSIHKMIQDGTQGTIYGPGLVQLLNGSPLPRGRTDGNIYNALRAYNSGGINMDNLSDSPNAMGDYVSNIANYLQGWNGYGDGPKYCDFSTGTNTSPNPPKSS